MSGERLNRGSEILPPAELSNGTRQLSAFRKIPKAEDIDAESAFKIAVYGAANWIRSVEHKDWDTIAEKAVELYLGGVTDIKTLCATLDISPTEFEDHLDITKIKAFVDGEVARKIYDMALDGNEKMLKLVAERRLGWGKHDTLEIEGEIKLRPILNMTLLSDKEEAMVRSGQSLNSEAVEAEFTKEDNDKEEF